MAISGGEATVIAGAIGAGSALVAATLASWVTYKTTKRSVTSAQEEGERQRIADAGQQELDRAHAWNLAAQERRQVRRREAYIIVQRYASSWSRYAEWRIRLFETDPPTPEPAIVEPGESEMVIAELQASAEVAMALTAFTTLVQHFRIAVAAYEQASEMGLPASPGQQSDAHEAFDRLEKAGRGVIDAADALRDLMRQELGANATPD